MMDVFTPNCLYCRYWLPAASCPKHVHGNQERWWWEPFYVKEPMPVYCILQAIVLHLPNDAWKHPKNRFLERLNYWINPTKIKLKWIQWFPCCLNWPLMQEISLLTDTDCSLAFSHFQRLRGIWSEILAVFLFCLNTRFHWAHRVVICFQMFYGTVGDEFHLWLSNSLS